jgi:hypothetical protein
LYEDGIAYLKYDSFSIVYSGKGQTEFSFFCGDKKVCTLTKSINILTDTVTMNGLEGRMAFTV